VVHEHRPFCQQVSLIHVNSLPTIPSPTTLRLVVVAFARYPSAQPLSFSGLDFARGVQAHRGRLAVSSSLSYGLAVHLLLLSTTHRCVAVAFGFRPESVSLERTFTSLTIALSGAHTTGFSRVESQLPLRLDLGKLKVVKKLKLHEAKACGVCSVLSAAL
jgi:hypothetical protein